MGENDTKPAKTKPTGRTINFNLVGDDLHLYETLRDTYQDEVEADEELVTLALEDLDPDVRALVKAKFAPKAAARKDKGLSHRQVFVRALTEAQAARDAAADEDEAQDDGTSTEG